MLTRSFKVISANRQRQWPWTAIFLLTTAIISMPRLFIGGILFEQIPYALAIKYPASRAYFIHTRYVGRWNTDLYLANNLGAS